MPRKRMISPEFWTDSKILQLSDQAKLLFIGIWNFADDYGVIENDLIQMKVKILPLSNVEIKDLLQEITALDLIKLFYNDKYFYIENWNRHQKFHGTKRLNSNFPKPPESKYNDESEPVHEISLNGSRLKEKKRKENNIKKEKENIIYNNIDSNLNNNNSNNNEPEESPFPFFNNNKQERAEGNQYLVAELKQIKYNIIKNHKKALRGGNSDNWYTEKWNNGGDFQIIRLFKERMYSTDKGSDYVLNEFMKAIKWMFAGENKDSDFVRGNIVKAKNPFVSFANNYNAFRYDKDSNYRAPTGYSKEERIANMERNHKKYMEEHKDDDD